MVRDYNSEFQLWVDGVKVASDPDTGGALTAPTVRLGQHAIFTTAALNGSIDDFAIWNQALSAEQILSLKNNGMSTIVSNETSDGDVWRADVTPNDGTEDGTLVSSNTLTITNDATAPSISLTALSPDPNTDNTPTLTGTATEAISTVSTVQFQMDGTSGSWSNCTANDGTFNAASEAFTCTVTSALSDGSHTIYIRATDSNNLTTSGGSETTDTFTIDTTSPNAFSLESPGNGDYTNNLRPTFRWKAATTPDATTSLSKYVLELDNGDTGDIRIDDIPASGTTNIDSSPRYVISYQGFDDNDSSNNYISVYTKSSDTWSSDQNDGQLKQGKRTWKVTAHDQVGNTTSASRDLYLDTTGPTLTNTAISNNGSAGGYTLVTDTIPEISGTISDNLAYDKVQASFYKQNFFLGVKTSTTLVGTFNLNVADLADQDNSDDTVTTSFKYTPSTSLDYGFYELKINGLDKAGNQSADSSFQIQILTGTQARTALQAEADQAEREAAEEESAIPSQLFDIKLELDADQIDHIQDLVARVIFESFGTEPTPVDIKVIILDQKGNEVYRDEGGEVDIVVETESIYSKSFENFAGDLPAGKYTLVLITVYNTDVIDEFSQSFTIKEGLPKVPISQRLMTFFEALDYRISTANAETADLLSQAFLQAYLAGQERVTTASNNLQADVEAVNRSLSDPIEMLRSIRFNWPNGDDLYAMLTAPQRQLRDQMSIAQKQITNQATIAQKQAGQAGESVKSWWEEVREFVAYVAEVYIDDSPTAITAVKIEEIGSNYAVISWETNHYTINNQVNYGQDLSYGQKAFGENREKQHRVRLENLKPGSSYVFEVMSQNKNYVYDAYYTFETLAE